MPKLRGRLLVVEVKPSGATDWTDISGASRTFEYEDKAGEIDVTTRDSTAKEALDDFPEISAKYDGLQLDTAEGAPALTTLPRGSSGDIRWFEQGKADGKPMESSKYRVMRRKKTYPYDGAVGWEIEMSLTSDIVEGSYSATP